jgi:hypothetical protein
MTAWHPARKRVGIGTARARLRPEGVGEHVVCLCGVLQSGKELRFAAELPEPMPKLDQRGDPGSREGSPAGLPALNGVGIHPDLLGEAFLTQAGGLADQLEQVPGDDPIPGPGDGITATSTHGGRATGETRCPTCHLSALLPLALPLSDRGGTRTPGQWDSRPLDPNVPLRQTKAVELADQPTGQRESDDQLRPAQDA